jgi:VacB/RNase II family 3'-5' exoribonuclease
MSSDPSARSRLISIAHRAMVERGLEPEIPPAAQADAARLTDAHAADSSLQDLRGLLWCSIDNDDSRDLDQLTVADRIPDGPEGTTRVRVAIADVDRLVPRDSPIDDHARANTTSVYTPAKVFPMLPERLSTDLTSLVEGQERTSVVIEFTVTDDGHARDATVYRARVLNKAKLAYNSVAAWLDDKAPAPAALASVPGLDENLRLQHRAAQSLRQRRHEQGALTLESSGAHVVFAGEALSDVEPDEKNDAKALIEDFMIAANGATAEFLGAHRSPSIRRVLRAPRNWHRIVALARESGVDLPAAPDARALDEFLNERRRADPDRFPDLSLSVVKLLGSGEYALVRAGARVEGHFGLAVRDYAHSTAPNRRFPDLITQRLLKAALAGAAVPYGDDELERLAAECTTREDAAEKVERQVRKSAAALLLSGRVGQRFDAIVTGASEKGTWVRIRRPAVEGRVIRGEAGLDVGERTQVELVATDVDRGFIDFARVR